MNALLARTLTFLNAVLGIGIILAGLIMGYQSGAVSGNAPLGLIGGGIGGLVAAAFLCGIIGLLSQIEHHLRTLLALATRAGQS